MIRLVLGMLVGGGVLVFFGVQEWRLGAGTTAEPQPMTCSQLIENGPGVNAHVEMGDFLLCETAYVYEGESESDFDTVWVPAVPIDGEYAAQLFAALNMETGEFTGSPPVPRDVRVIVKSSEVENGSDVSDLGARETIRGLIVNRVESLDAEEKKLLAESYPGTDFEQVWILEHDRRPAGMGKKLGFIGGGLALMCLGGFVGLGMMKSDEA